MPRILPLIRRFAQDATYSRQDITTFKSNRLELPRLRTAGVNAVPRPLVD